ncbi:MAG: GNAT family N-acetyltransferase [Coriobacteriales bacterium]|nr:GNAT family N-acetyltransferase [Coriobacteriales bacterium]
MPKKPLPTGEEPPKGYESIINRKPQARDLRVDCAFISQLASIELAEINSMRKQAFSGIESLVGLTNEPNSFEREISILPGKEASDKLLFRAYRDKALVGYALVVIGWPNKGNWVIQHLIINPQHRQQGIGSTIIRKVEKFALESEVEATSLFAIPLEERGVLFWQNMGYTTETGRLPIKIANLDHELIIYRKEL